MTIEEWSEKIAEVMIEMALEATSEQDHKKGVISSMLANILLAGELGCLDEIYLIVDKEMDKLFAAYTSQN